MLEFCRNLEMVKAYSVLGALVLVGGIAVVALWPERPSSSSHEPPPPRSLSRPARSADKLASREARPTQDSFEVVGEAMADDAAGMDVLIDTYGATDEQKTMLREQKAHFTRLKVVKVGHAIRELSASIQTAEDVQNVQLPAYDGGAYPIELNIVKNARDPNGILPGRRTDDPDSIVVLKCCAQATQAFVGSRSSRAAFHYDRDGGSKFMFIGQTSTPRPDLVLGTCNHENCGGHH